MEPFRSSRKLSGAAWSLALLLSLAPCAAQTFDLAADPLLPGIWRLDGITPGLASTDLEPLRQKIGKATVVALGESIHGSGGYYVAKHRVFRYLVERAGFRAIGFQTPWSAADSVAAYVKTCQGSPEEALKGIDSVFQSAEVLELVKWMCDWNRTHKKPKDRLDFFGFDIQQPEADGAALIAFLARIGITGGDPIVAGLQRCNGVSGPRAPRGGVQEGDHADCTEAIGAIDRRFSSDSKNIIRKTSKKDFEWAKARLASLESWQGYTFYEGRDFARADEERDFGMAYMVRAMQTLRLPKNTKLAAWAHNFHMSRAPLRGGPDGVSSTMGTFLSGSLGSKYFAVGFIGMDVSVDQPGFCGLARAPAPQSLEAKLHELGEEYLLVDPRVGSQVLTPGNVYPVSGFNLVPQDHYDAFVYLDESPKMIPLGRPPC